MRRLLFVLLPFLCIPDVAAQTPEANVSQVLDAFHKAASDGDFDAYFGLFATESVFIGTDSWERWPRPEFEEYVRARFDEGGGWTYVSTERHIGIASDGETAWFDEMLQNASYGTTRGSGVLVRDGGVWKVAQYNLSMPVPNELARDFVARIRERDESLRGPQNAIEALVDSIAIALVDSGSVAGMAVGVIQNGDTLVLNRYGMADLEYGLPTPAHAVFEIGSVTKQFTAAGILRLVERGEIDLGADITTYLPAFDTQGRSITVARLLDHTSGIQGYTEMPDFEAIAVQALPRDTLVSLIGSWPFWHEPGDRQIYNNSAYFLAGLIIEAVADTTYEAFLGTEFFDPLGMDDSRYCSNTDLVPRRMHGYGWTPNGLLRADYLNHLWPFAAGSICSSVEDLLTWTRSLHGGKVLGRDAYDRMITAQPLNDGSMVRYGTGLVLTPISGHRAIHHGGGINGFLSDVAYLPDLEATVVVLINTTGPGSPQAITGKIVAALAGPDDVAAVPLDLALDGVLGSWSGTDRGGSAVFTVEQQDGSIGIRRGERSIAELVYVGDGWFASPDGVVRVGFAADATGRIRMHVDQGYGYAILDRME